MDIENVFAERLREAREGRGWSQSELSKRVTDAGHKLDRWAIANLEKGERRARLNDVIALAAALGVPPLSLLYGDVDVTPARSLRAPFAAAWMVGLLPLTREDVASYFDAVTGATGAGIQAFTGKGLYGLLESTPPTETESEALRAHVDMEALALEDLERVVLAPGLTDDARRGIEKLMADRHEHMHEILDRLPEEKK